MNFPWYAIVATVLGGILLIAVTASIIIYLLRKRNLNSYRKLETEEDKHDDNEDKAKLLEKVDKVGDIVLHQSEVEASIDTQTNAESCTSDLFADGNYESHGGRRLSSPISRSLANRAPITLHLSFVLNSEKKYLAGKVTKIEGMPTGPNQVKIHVSLLPFRKYMLKTRYYDINSAYSFDEYFKTKFKVMPDIEKSAIRFRLYCRRLRFGISSRDWCLGECYVKLSDIAEAPGGLTLSREIRPKPTRKFVSQVSLP